MRGTPPAMAVISCLFNIDAGARRVFEVTSLFSRSYLLLFRPDRCDTRCSLLSYEGMSTRVQFLSENAPLLSKGRGGGEAGEASGTVRFVRKWTASTRDGVRRRRSVSRRRVVTFVGERSDMMGGPPPQ
jgi:hypothetical protein